MSKLFGVVGLVLLVVFLIVIGPILVIWALNTLFPALVIPYSLATWFAVVILGAFLHPNVTVKKS